MTLTQLTYIAAVAQHRHFGAAAEACFITQPTLSMQIQKLEEELGVEIFDRSRQPIRLTPSGEEIVLQARLVLAEAEKIAALSAEETDAVAKQIRLGIIPTLSPTLVPRIVSWFSKHYPETDLFLEEVQTQNLIGRLRDASLDIGLAVTPLGDSQLKERPLFYEPFVLYVSPDHALAKVKTVSSGSLNSGELWLLSEGHCFRDQALHLCQDRKKKKDGKHVVFESGSLETLKKMVDLNGGYTLLPFLDVGDLSSERLRSQVREFALPIPTREVSLIYSKLYKRKATLDAVATSLRASIPKALLKPEAKKFERVPV